MVIKRKYLVVYTDEAAPEKHVTATDENGNLLFEMQARKSKAGKPFYLDVTRFIGQNVIFNCDGDEFHFDSEADSLPKPRNKAESFRPLLHYSVPYGWLNDPNGLIFLNGKYHIFCQHNPLGTGWGNMHWHHAVTTDFIHFDNLGDSLFPDETGTMFSGSAVCDTNNVTEIGKNAVLLYYTCASYSNDVGFSQCLAYSDDAVNFKKYTGNPVVPNIIGENRDPKTVWVDEMGCYVTALYLDGNEYRLLKSDNLLDWTEFQSLQLPDDGECPDLYCIKENGKWIFSGASDYYLVGHFDKFGFVAEQKAYRHFLELDGRLSYAAQSFSGTDGRAIRLTWENISPGSSQCFCGQLSVPFEMSLATLDDGSMRLRSRILKEFEKSLVPIDFERRKQYIIPCPAFVADLEFDGEAFSVRIDETELVVSSAQNTITYNGASIPLTLSGKKSIRLIADRMSIEILADDGLIFSCIRSLSDKDSRTLMLSDGNINVKILKGVNHE